MKRLKKEETIVFGGGCFWCMEAVFGRLKGVIAVTPGYAGGTLNDPTYVDVIYRQTGHAEVIQVTYDPQTISFEDLLNVFFGSHDPTTKNQQGGDIGPQYRSLILTTTAEQQAVAKVYVERLEREGVFATPITTEIMPLKAFYPAEEEHVNFYQKNPLSPYCQVVISPKLAQLRQKFAHLLH